VTNNQPAGGFAVTPVWLGVHDGTFDLFNPGDAAMPFLESVAELGNTGPLMTAFSGMGPQTTLTSGGPLPQFLPGNSNFTDLNVMDPATTRYLSFAAMVVPSNDLFMGNSNPLAFPIFDSAGNFAGPLTIQIFGSMVWDAGTEVNNIGDGPAFITGIDAMLGTTENGTVHLFFTDPNAATYLASINGQLTPGGTISHLLASDELLATIFISAPVPEPSSLALGGIGLCGLFLGLVRHNRRRSVH
jgi:PEP-CTERM motif